jgi:hypothetical protein
MIFRSEVHASESGHWYARDGSPVYQVPAKSGAMRPATLADARKMGLVPGVSGVMGCAAKPGLVRWQIQQGVLAAMTLPRRPEESDEQFIARVLQDSQEQARKAAERGTAIHAAIQGHYEGTPPDEQYWPYVKAAVDAVDTWLRKNPAALMPSCFWKPEASFASPLGYGGKVDLHGFDAVLDFKSKDFEPPVKVLAFDEHCMQLAAYRNGLGMRRARCANVFVSTKVPGLIHIHEWDEEELDRGWEQFVALLAYWKASRGYDSAFQEAMAA